MPNPPARPDFLNAANQQGAANLTAAQQQARLNNANFQGIGGSQNVTFNPDGTPNVTQSLTPEQQAIYGNYTGNQAAAGSIAGGLLRTGSFGGPMDFSGLAPTGEALDMNRLPGLPGSYDNVRQSVIDAMMGRANTEFGQRESGVNSDLIARGIGQGTEAYRREMERIDQARNDARSRAEIAGGDAATQAIQADLARRGAVQGEQAQQFGQQNSLRGIGANEMVTGRTLPMSELTGLMGLSRFDMPNLPGYSQNNQVAPAPVFGATQAASNYDVDLWNAAMQQQNSQLNGLLGLGNNFVNSNIGGRIIDRGINALGNWWDNL